MPVDSPTTTVSYAIVSTLLLAIVSFRRAENEKRIRLRRERKNKSCIGNCFGFDIGGTLSKLVFFNEHRPEKHFPEEASAEHVENHRFTRNRTRSRSISEGDSYLSAIYEMRTFLLSTDAYGGSGKRDTSLTLSSSELDGELHFIRFESQRMQGAIEMMTQGGFHHSIRTLCCTGGGAHKFESVFQDILGIKIQKSDELESLILGLNFLIRTVVDEVFTFEDVNLRTLQASKKVVRGLETPFPYLLVNIGSGVSILKVSGTEEIDRVSGTSLGGGTYLGLCCLLTKCKSFDEVLDLAVRGDNSKVDLLVGDIYGGNYENFSLSAKTIASSFGKLIGKDEPREGIKEADIARALLIMITQNIGQIAYMNAVRFGVKNIFFVGNFMRHNEISNRTLAYAINFWSKGEMQANFVRHEGYFGALGTLLQSRGYNHKVS